MYTSHPEQPARIDACVDLLTEKYNIPPLVDDDDIDDDTNDRKDGRFNNNAINNNSIVTLIDVASSSQSTSAHQYQPFTNQELNHARSILTSIHSGKHVSTIEQRCRSSRSRRVEEGKAPLGFVGYIDDDTYLTTESFDVCLRATAAWIKAVDHVLGTFGKKEKVRVGREMDVGIKEYDINDNNDFSSAGIFCSDDSVPSTIIPAAIALTRPPGHHATPTLSNGFCLFNFCAAAAIHAISSRRVKVAIIDWDVHYGQGTAAIIRSKIETNNNDDNNVDDIDIAKYIRYVSVHQSPAFPYMGDEYSRDSNGSNSNSNDGANNNNNILTVPIPPGSTWENGFKDGLQVAFDFALGLGNENDGHVNDHNDGNYSLEQNIIQDDDEKCWTPDLVIVSSGYDGLYSDELASVGLHSKDYGKSTKMLLEYMRRTEQQQQRRSRGREEDTGVIGGNNCRMGLVLGLEGGYSLANDVPGGNLQYAVLETVESLRLQSL